jgi:outer membrane protein OmpA-like peptidoglycan-associated protein
MGKGDIFFSRKKPDGSWSGPFNLGFPINTFNNELGLIVNAGGDMAYFASDRIKVRALDIYKFFLYPSARPIPVSYMKGRVYDSRSLKGLEALFQLIDLKSGEMVVESISAPVIGDFLIPLPVDRDYALNVSKAGYLFYSDHFSFRGIHVRTDPFIKDVALNPILQGEKIVLNNIFYDFDSWELLPESRIELNKIVDFLNLNPLLIIEISGHTDSIGSQSYNIELSEKRAKSVIDYLNKNGIDANRLTYKGFGASQPVETNETEEGRAKNRRTELRIIN